MKILVAKKLKMTRIFTEDGTSRAVTALEAKPTEVSELKTVEKHGYGAVKVATQNRKKIKYSEFRADADMINLSLKDKITVESFSAGDIITVIGTSKGKGFAGTIKRYHFHKGPETHGSNQQRRLGSIGAGYPQRVIKGQKMPGHMGNERVTVKNLEIIEVDPKNNIMLVAGAIPGNTGGEVRVIGN